MERRGAAGDAEGQGRGLIEGRRLARVVGLPGADRMQKLVRAVMTGYLLHMLTGDKAYRDFADPEVALPKAAVRTRSPTIRLTWRTRSSPY